MAVWRRVCSDRIELQMRNSSAKKTEAVLLAIGLTLFAIFLAFRIHSFLSSRAGLRKFAALNEVSRRGSFPKLREADPSLWSKKRIEAYMQSLAVPGDDPIAALTIRKISLEVPIYEGTDEIVLNRGAGRIPGTARPGEEGNIGIAGHRDGFFRGLKDLQLGDKIELATRTGIASYVVSGIEIVLPDDISVLQPKDHSMLTLVTCYPFYFVGDAPKRYIVHATIVGQGRPESRTSNAETNKTNKQEIIQ
jgi:sortase A